MKSKNWGLDHFKLEDQWDEMETQATEIEEWLVRKKENPNCGNLNFKWKKKSVFKGKAFLAE